MTQGVTGTFAINGVELLAQPTEHKWIDKNLVGISGEARPIYPSVRQYELTWNYIPMTEFSQLLSFYQYSQNSGTVSVDIPKWATTPYQFFTYSGCTLKEPTVGAYFVEHVSDVSLLILKVRTL